MADFLPRMDLVRVCLSDAASGRLCSLAAAKVDEMKPGPPTCTKISYKIPLPSTKICRKGSGTKVWFDLYKYKPFKHIAMNHSMFESWEREQIYLLISLKIIGHFMHFWNEYIFRVHSRSVHVTDVC
jgi:hypothetical protein